MNYGLQMFSVRDTTKNDLIGTLKAVAKVGYKDIEFAGFFGNSPEALKAALDENSLTCNGIHSHFDDLDRDFSGMMNYMHKLGATDFIIASAPIANRADVDRLVANIIKYKPMLAAEGLTLSYHNHYTEFLPNTDKQIPHDELRDRTDIDFEIDTSWAYVGGRDPVKILEELRDRVHVIHLRDVIVDRSGENHHKGRALGEGEVPVEAIWLKARELGMRMVVESGGLDPTGIEEVTRCMNYLRKLEADHPEK